MSEAKRPPYHLFGLMNDADGHTGLLILTPAMPPKVAAAFKTYRELSFKPCTPEQEMLANHAEQFFLSQMGFSIDYLMTAHAQKREKLDLEQ